VPIEFRVKHFIKGNFGMNLTLEAKTGPVWPGKTRPRFLKILQQPIHMNLSNYIFRTFSSVDLYHMQPAGTRFYA